MVTRLAQGWHRYVLEESSTSRGGVGARLFLCCSRNDDKCQTGAAANIANIIFIVVWFFFATVTLRVWKTHRFSLLMLDRAERPGIEEKMIFFLDEKGFGKKGSKTVSHQAEARRPAVLAAGRSPLPLLEES